MVRKLISIITLTIIGWNASVEAVPTYPIRQWSDVDGNTITAQMIDVSNSTITLIRPEMEDIHGNPIEFEIPHSRASQEDQQYIEQLLELKAEFNLKLTKLKAKFPNPTRCARGHEEAPTFGTIIKSFAPTQEFSDRYESKCEALEFKSYHQQITYIEDHLESDLYRFSRMTHDHKYKSTVAKEHQQNFEWIEAHFKDYIMSLLDLGREYQEAVDALEKKSYDQATPQLLQ